MRGNYLVLFQDEIDGSFLASIYSIRFSCFHFLFVIFRYLVGVFLLFVYLCFLRVFLFLFRISLFVMAFRRISPPDSGDGDGWFVIRVSLTGTNARLRED